MSRAQEPNPKVARRRRMQARTRHARDLATSTRQGLLAEQMIRLAIDLHRRRAEARADDERARMDRLLDQLKTQVAAFEAPPP